MRLMSWRSAVLLNRQHIQKSFESFGQGISHLYVGFDATAPSLTMGHLIPLMSMLHLYRAGHRPIFLLGGGTTMIGDRRQVRYAADAD